MRAFDSAAIGGVYPLVEGLMLRLRGDAATLSTNGGCSCYVLPPFALSVGLR